LPRLAAKYCSKGNLLMQVGSLGPAHFQRYICFRRKVKKIRTKNSVLLNYTSVCWC